jgi:hypothetical protein
VAAANRVAAVKNKPSGVVPPIVNMPSITDPEGLFDVILWGIILLAAIILAYLLLFGTY